MPVHGRGYVSGNRCDGVSAYFFRSLMSLAGQLQNVRWWVRACVRAGGRGERNVPGGKLGTRAVAPRDERAVAPHELSVSGRAVSESTDCACLRRKRLEAKVIWAYHIVRLLLPPFEAEYYCFRGELMRKPEVPHGGLWQREWKRVAAPEIENYQSPEEC